MITSEFRLGVVDSTMEAAKTLAVSQDFLLVSADGQTKGKGTRGRAWQSLRGNAFMTLGIHRRNLPAPRLALLPLEIGLYLWEESAAMAAPGSRADLSLKWPNDLLFKGAKVAGILMESHGEFLLAGIGINVAEAPAVEDGGSASACLAEAGMPPERKDALVDALYRRVVDAIGREDGFEADDILVGWQGKVDWTRKYRLRDRQGRPSVLPLGVNNHGHLQVRHEDGTREWLVSDYLL